MTRLLIAIGLVVAAAFGLAGGFLSGLAQDTFYFVSSVGFIVGCALYAARAGLAGRDILAVGLGLLAGAEVLMSAGGAVGEPGAASAFAHAVALYVAALGIIAASQGTPTWTRLTAVGAAVAFAGHVAEYIMGRDPPQDSIGASIGYTLLTLTFIGWIIGLYRGSAAPAAATRVSM